MIGVSVIDLNIFFKDFLQLFIKGYFFFFLGNRIKITFKIQFFQKCSTPQCIKPANYIEQKVILTFLKVSSQEHFPH